MGLLSKPEIAGSNPGRRLESDYTGFAKLYHTGMTVQTDPPEDDDSGLPIFGVTKLNNIHSTSFARYKQL